MTIEEIKIANATYRRNGSSVFDKNGKIRSVVANYVTENISKDKKILDFGCGSEFIQGKYLRELGFNVDGWDFGVNKPKNCVTELNQIYDVVYASNVLNVLSSGGALRETLIQIRSCLKDGALFIANYPQSPRKLNLTVATMENLLRFFFGENIKRIKYNSATIWVIKKKADSEFAKHQEIAV
jgi:2-polyprenyl-3-methyl-5-hydroxy-6-metoxy-1,4-benzoquinol methylase